MFGLYTTFFFAYHLSEWFDNQKAGTSFVGNKYVGNMTKEEIAMEKHKARVLELEEKRLYWENRYQEEKKSLKPFFGGLLKILGVFILLCFLLPTLYFLIWH